MSRVSSLLQLHSLGNAHLANEGASFTHPVALTTFCLANTSAFWPSMVPDSLSQVTTSDRGRIVSSDREAKRDLAKCASTWAPVKSNSH